MVSEAVRKATEINYKNGIFTDEQQHSYAISGLCFNNTRMYLKINGFFFKVTEAEIINGMFKAENVEDKCLVLFRDLVDLDDSSDKHSKNLDRYIETNQESNELLNMLRENLKNSIPKRNIISIPVEWSAFNNDNVELRAYLDVFSQTIIDSIEKLIKKNIQELNSTNNNEELVDSEIMHHAYFCNKKLQDFVERSEYTNKVI